METFFANMEPTLRIYWYIAIGSSIFFIVQTILTFTGSGSDDVDANFDGDLDVSDHPFQLFSLRNLINFLLGFGWGGVSLYGVIGNKFLLGVCAFLIGLGFIAIFFLVMRFMWKLAENNSFKIEDTLNKTADVYLPIPPNKEGKGKVQISVKGSVHELDAITLNDRRLERGKLVTVTGIENSLLIVAPLK